MPSKLQPIHLSPAQRIGAVLAPALLVLAFGAAGWWGTVRVSRSRAAVGHSHQTIEALQGLLTTLVDAETGQRGYLLTGNDSYLAPFRDAGSRVRPQIQALERLVEEDGPAAQARVGNLDVLVRRKFAELQETIDSARAGRRAAAPPRWPSWPRGAARPRWTRSAAWPARWPRASARSCGPGPRTKRAPPGCSRR